MSEACWLKGTSSLAPWYAKPGAHQRHRRRQGPAGGGGAGERSRGHTGIVDEEVDAAVLALDPGAELLDARLVGDVALLVQDRPRPAAARLPHRLGGCESQRFVAACEEHVRVGGGQRVAQLLDAVVADALVRAGDDR